MPGFLIGIAGGTASGKTTLAKILKNCFTNQITILRSSPIIIVEGILSKK